MEKQSSSQFDILPGKQIPYYEETQKRSFTQKLYKVKNTILLLFAYACPFSKMRICLHRWRGVNIGKNVYIGMFCFLDNLYPNYIYIENNASVNTGAMIITHFNPMKQYAPIFTARVEPVLIKEGAIIAVKSVIMPGVVIGKNAVVSAASVVEKNVPGYTLVKGNPARKMAEFENLLTKK